MTDVLTKKQRSLNMSRIRGKWTSQEKLIHNHLKSMKIRHQMHPRIKGRPDVLLTDTNTLIFLDGCFWHKCPKCFKMPRTRRDFWKKKINDNVKRDIKINRILREDGYRIIRIWEHQIKKNENYVKTKIINALAY